MKKSPTEIEIPEISVEPRPVQTIPTAPSPRLLWVALAAGVVAVAVSLSLLPSSDPTTTPISSLPDPAPVTTSPGGASIISTNERPGNFTWIEVEGLDRFEAITGPVESGGDYYVVGNPEGVSGSATVLVSDDGSQWNRIGTIHGVGGEVQVTDLVLLRGRLLAAGTYTDDMPLSDREPRRLRTAVWYSDDGIGWEMVSDDFDLWPTSITAGSEAAVLTGIPLPHETYLEAYISLPVDLRNAVGRGDLSFGGFRSDRLDVTAGPFSVYSTPLSGSAGTASGQSFYRSDDGVTWDPIDPIGEWSGFRYQVISGPDGSLIAIATDATTLVSMDGSSWGPAVDLPLAGSAVPGPGGSLISISGDIPILRIWRDGVLQTVRMDRSLSASLAGLAATDRTMAILRTEYPPAAQYRTESRAGDYRLLSENGMVTVYGRGDLEIANWSVNDGPIPAEYDPVENAVLVITEDGQELTLPVQGLSEYRELDPAMPENSIAISSDGVSWLSAEIPTTGYASLVGSIGDRYLITSSSPETNLWPRVIRYQLVEP